MSHILSFLAWKYLFFLSWFVLSIYYLMFYFLVIEMIFFFIFDIVSLYQKMTNITSKVLVDIFLKVCSTSMLLVLPFHFLECAFYSLWMFSMKALASVGNLLFNALAANETVKQISRCGALNSVHQSDLHINTCNL